MKTYFQILLMLIITAGYSAVLQAADTVTDPGSSTETNAITAEPGNTPVTHSNRNGIKVEFDLLDREGKRVTQNDFLGKHVLLTFGYTHCEHICPIIVSNIARTLKASGNGSAGIFISVDTERDSPAITDDFAAGFNKKITGLSGSYDDISAAVNNFKVSYSVTKTQKHYIVLHSTDIFFVGPEGQLLDIFNFNSLPLNLN